VSSRHCAAQEWVAASVLQAAARGGFELLCVQQHAATCRPEVAKIYDTYDWRVLKL
jgi:hypothetical protein